MNEYVTGYRVELNGRDLQVDLVYPRQRGVERVRVGLEEVRAASDLIIEFDFARNGWSISRDVSTEDEVFGRVELALIPAFTGIVKEGR